MFGPLKNDTHKLQLTQISVPVSQRTRPCVHYTDQPVNVFRDK